MNQQPRHAALVTGASAGIGEAFATELAARGYDLVLTARREAQLQRVAHELEQRHGVRALVLPADLADPQAPTLLMRGAEEAGFEIGVLINNAGYGIDGHFSAHSWREHADFLQVMLVAVSELCHLALPGMVRRDFGRIINVASVAGLIPVSAGHTLYGATKSYLIKFSEALAAEHAGTNVHITASCPGFTYSEFHDVLGIRAQVSRLPRIFWMEAEPVVHDALDACDRGESVTIPGPFNRAISGLAKLVPAKLGRQIISSRTARLRRRAE